MVTPDHRGVAVERLVDRFGVSQRRACQVGQHRLTQRCAPTARFDIDATYGEWLHAFA